MTSRVPVMALALTGLISSAASATETENQSPDLVALQARVMQLESQIERLTGDVEQSNWLTNDPEQTRAMFDEVLRDAELRSSLLGAVSGASYNKGFRIESPDGLFTMVINGQGQVRYVYNNQDDMATDSDVAGFEIRRAKLKFKGNIYEESIFYQINGAFDRGSGTFTLEDLVLGKNLDDGITVQGGQFKLPFMVEENTSSSRTQTVDRSLINEEFNQDRSQGIQISGGDDAFRWMGAISDGFNTDNTSALTRDTEGLAVTGRVEVIIDAENGADWGLFKDTTSTPGKGSGTRLGAAAHYEVEEFGTVADMNEEKTFTWTADAQIEFDGANILAYIVGRHLDVAGYDQYGCVIQGGVYLDDQTELFGRYEIGDLDHPMYQDLSVITVGVNRYIHGHGLKVTADVGFGLEEVAMPFASSGVGWRADPMGQDGQIVGRLQTQFTF